MTTRLVVYRNGVMSLETLDEKGKLEKRETIVRVVYADDALRRYIADSLRELLRADGRLQPPRRCQHDPGDPAPCGWCYDKPLKYTEFVFEKE